ncbi:MAG: hypothetical protein DRR19_28510 [Candidatus Parabeggiatoa sp. nov. 1]|nr:MAG: hypothetical protein DRR19_28510 [Gammaproteobacteria bacterium]
MRFLNQRAVTLCSLLFISLFSIHTAQAVNCNNYQAQVNQALYWQDLDQLAQLLRTLKKLPDCSAPYLDWLERRMSNMASKKAKYWVQRGQLNRAEKWLKYKYTPVNLWQTQSVRGDIAAKRKQWSEAAMFYNQALDLIVDPKATPQKPSRADIERVYKLATETQLLAGTLTNVRSSGHSSGAMRNNIAGIEIKERPIPIQFVFGKTALTKTGQDTAQKLVTYFQREQPDNIILIGHTDRVGSDAYNCFLSTKRAKALKNYIVASGIRADMITTIGKGERAPLELYEPSLYTQNEIDQINRRVEFAINSAISYDNACL